MPTQDEFAKELDKAIALVERVASDLLRRPGVVAVGPGTERRRGKPTGRAAIVITVRQKLSLRELKEHGIDALPKNIEGIPVDVIEFQKPVESPEVRRAIDRAIQVKDQVAEEWLQTPNVTAIAVGYKRRGGEMTGEIAIQVFVARKLSPADVEEIGSRLVPANMQGVPTDVIEMGPLTEIVAPSGSRADRRDPLVGGLAIGHATAPFHYGTLAAVAFDSANNAVALSNEHVLDGDIGETVNQPSPVGLDDSFEVSLQLDVCNPLNFLRIDTPDTLGGSILAGAAAAAALAAALSDEIDPTREGQEATVPPAGARTQEEYTKVKVDYPSFPLPGTAFELGVAYTYERRTDMGNFQSGAEKKRQNPHILRYHRLFTDRSLYDPSGTIRLYGVVISGDDRTLCKSYHCVALLRPLRMDRSYPVVLRAISRLNPEFQKHLAQLFRLLEQLEVDAEEQELLKRHIQQLCLYYGEFSASGIPLGPWRHWMHVQTVNVVPPGTDPLKAAQIIGGLPVSNHYKETLDIACGPFVFDDDGSFDIELLSI
jgi:hypothetical protein